MAARKKEIPILDETTLELDPGRCGLKGSPTHVVSTAVRTAQRQCRMLADARQLAQLLADRKGGAGHEG
jgi:electron transfer flavoprotein alpha/beta subunit